MFKVLSKAGRKRAPGWRKLIKPDLRRPNRQGPTRLYRRYSSMYFLVMINATAFTPLLAHIGRTGTTAMRAFVPCMHLCQYDLFGAPSHLAVRRTLSPILWLLFGHDPFAAGNIKKLCTVKLVFFRCVLFRTAICLNFVEAIRPHTSSVICVCSAHLMLFKADFNFLHWLKSQR